MRWLAEILPAEKTKREELSPYDFVAECVKSSSVQGVVLYDDTEQQQRLVPNIITAAGVLEAVPLSKDMQGFSKLAGSWPFYSVKVRFDAAWEWMGKQPHEATLDAHRRWVSQTTGMAIINPGVQKNKAPPEKMFYLNFKIPFFGGTVATQPPIEKCVRAVACGCGARLSLSLTRLLAAGLLLESTRFTTSTTLS